MPASKQAAIRWVPISPLVLSPQMKKVPNSSQKSRERDPSAQRAEGDARKDCRWSGAGRPRSPSCRRAPARHRAGVPASAASPAATMTSAAQATTEHGGTPAKLLDDHGEQRQEQQLPGRGAGGQHAHHQAALFGEPAVDDGGPQDQGVMPVPVPTTTPHSRTSCQGAVISGVRGDAATPPAPAI